MTASATLTHEQNAAGGEPRTQTAPYERTNEPIAVAGRFERPVRPNHPMARDEEEAIVGGTAPGSKYAGKKIERR